jgi:hypothetical protein
MKNSPLGGPKVVAKSLNGPCRIHILLLYHKGTHPAGRREPPADTLVRSRFLQLSSNGPVPETECRSAAIAGPTIQHISSKELNMVVSVTTKLARLRDEIGDYFKTALADFYVSSAHRWLVYAIAFILVGLCTFLSLDARAIGNPLLKSPLTFKGMYAWHTAINFAFWLATVDQLAAWLFKPWASYNRRTVGKAWILFMAAFMIGYLFQRTLVFRLVSLYAPGLVWYYEVVPSERPGILSMFLFMLPVWLTIAYAIIAIALKKQAQVQELLRVRIDTILEERRRPAPFRRPSRPQDNKSKKLDDEAAIQLPAELAIAPIHLSQVGHVTVEDHYLRVYYHSDGELKNVLIRMPLKELGVQLQAAQFIRIHRSHIVNLEQVAGIKRAGRNMRVITKYGNFMLPVSRYRISQILPVIENYLHPDSGVGAAAQFHASLKQG